MRKLSAVFFAFVFLAACKGQGEKWVRYLADTAGNSIDTMSITFYKDEIVFEAGGLWNWTRQDSTAKHDDIFKYKIIDQMNMPADPRKTVYHLRTETDCDLYFNVFRAEKDRGAFNFSDLMYSPGYKGGSKLSLKRDSVRIAREENSMSWQSPWFYSESHVEHLKSLRGLASVNSDSVLWYCKTRLEYVKQNKARFERWGPAGYNYIYEEPGMAAMEAKGYNPWRVYAQLLSCCYPSDDSVFVQLNDEYRALLQTIK